MDLLVKEINRKRDGYFHNCVVLQIKFTSLLFSTTIFLNHSIKWSTNHSLFIERSLTMRYTNGRTTSVVIALTYGAVKELKQVKLMLSNC